MEKAFRLPDMHTNFVFGFFNKLLQPVELDPKYGKFELQQSSYIVDEEGNLKMTTDNIGVKQTTFDEDDDE